MILYLNAPTAASLSYKFTNKREMIAAINQNQNSSGAIYQIVMQANNVRLLPIAIVQFKQLRIIHPNNPFLEAGEGFSEFMEVGPCSYWYIVSRKKWPSHVTNLYQQGINDKRGPFQQPGDSIAGCQELRDALKHNSKDPYVMLMDTIANYIASAFFQDDISHQGTQYRNLSYRYMAMIRDVIKKEPQVGEAQGFLAVIFLYISDTYRGSASDHYTSLALSAFQNMHNPMSYWYDNHFSLELSTCYEATSHPNKAKVLLNYYFAHEVPALSTFAI